MGFSRKVSHVHRAGSDASGTRSKSQTITVVPTDGNPVELTLPFTARAHADKIVLLGFLAVVCFLGFIELGLLAMGELEGVPMFLMGSPLFAIAVMHHIRDSRDPRCSITLHPDWLWDRRLSNSPIPWNAFSKADIIRHREGVVKVSLALRRPLPQLRLGAFRSLFGPPRSISVNVQDMTISPDILANAVAHMVIRHDGTASGTGKYVEGTWLAWQPAPTAEGK